MITKLACTLIALLLLLSVSGCGSSSLLSKDDPVTLTMWHVYGEQADSPMNRLIQEFNETTGLENGVIINVTALSNGTDIGPMLRNAYANAPGALPMPDLFTCHTNNADELGAKNLIDWTELFSEEELSNYVDAFVKDGMVDGRLAVFPVSKSTHMLFINGTQFDLFSQDTGVTYDDLATWEGFFAAAEAFHE
ncbi:MAG: extracellular solute-binding protein [Clostridia bacterium]|nr:extracellular solute-binding protein [Clostridia bacterium]